MNKKTKICVIIIVVILLIFVISKMIKKDSQNNLELENNEIIQDNEYSDNDDVEEVKVKGYHLVTYKKSAEKINFINTLKVTSIDDSSIRFVIGKINSNSIVEERMEFNIDCKKGENEIDLSRKRYLLKQGEYLFMDINGQDVLYKKSDLENISLVESETKKRNGKMIISESNYLLPFEYELDEIDEYNVLMIGNEITTNNGKFGLGATEENLDYYSITKNRLEEIFKETNVNRINARDWEIKENSVDRKSWININISPKLASNLDLVIIQLGDNYNFENNFEEDILQLNEYIRKYSPGVEIIYIGMWFGTNKIINKLPGICERTNMEFVNISDLASNDDYKNIEAIRNPSKENEFYPNNEAMQVISNRIIEVLGY